MVFRRKTSFSISAAESVLQGEKLGLKIRCRTAKLCQFGFRPVEFEPQQIGQLLELSEKRADILQVRKHGVSILIAFTAKHNVAASILSCHNVSSGNLRKVNYFTIHSRSINGHLRHRYRQPKPARARAAWVEKQHSTTPLHRRPMRVTADHNLTASDVWIAPELFQIMQNVDTHATYPYYFGFRDCLCPRSFVVISTDGNNTSDRTQFL